MTSTIKLNADNYPIKSVTVFKSNKAEVVRVFDLSLQPGQSKIQISHLPRAIDTDSARVSGLGDAQLFDVVCSIGRGTEEIDPLSTSEVVRKLKVKKDALVQDRDALDDISGTMVDYSRTLVGDKVSPDQAGKFFDALLTRSQTLRTVLYRGGIRNLDEEMEVHDVLCLGQERKSDGEVTVVIVAEQATEIALKLTYLVQNATWSAAYELHATTEAGVPSSSVSLHYRARIMQSTGEDWTDVALTLSTADMNLSTQSIPTLTPTKIRPPKNSFESFHPSTNRQSQPAALLRSRPMMRMSTLNCMVTEPSPSPRHLHRFATPPHEPEPQPDLAPAGDEWQAVETDTTDSDELTPIAEPTAVVHESSLALTYHIEGASRVPSDGVPHQLAVAVLPFSATLQHVAVPKARPVAYLHATVRNTSDYRLLAGPVHTFVDDAFAARTALPHDVALGDTFHCTLGADPATRIRYARTSRRADKPLDAAARAFSEQWASTAFTSRTIIANSHPFALRELVLRDAVPVSEDGERVNVVLRHPAALADLEQGEELKIGAEVGEEAKEVGDEDEERRATPRRKVRWCKLVDGKGGRKEGLFEWVVDVGAGEEVTIETEWDVKAPVSLKWIESV
ncbi:hypothetical protein EDB92DRAFT_1936445 [Lactarius akahatsu]|uniref:Mucoidy inhibitor A n=1 Tax=Lactarius akahatsu TaxID=416441 RepID=A0AAD4LF86_9AGAM|nr:hypothetical protein EDB92DRAFT_1936445 [Lactarius akahatsu]